MTSSSHTASTTLDDIINELKLSYDSSQGLLEGDAVREIPSYNVLLNFSKLLNNLHKDLNESFSVDNKVIDLIKQELELGDSEENGLIVKQEEKAEPSEPENDSVVSEAHEELLTLPNKATEQSPKKRRFSQVEEDDKQSGNEDAMEEDLEEEDEADEDDEPLVKKEVNKDKEPEAAERLNSPDDPVPPVQEGHFTHENDTRLKNPKSEFVTAQSISKDAIAELGLFSEDNNGLETQGKEYLKRKYGVASYPENDLQDLLPGKIPDVDFSKNKPPSNQVQFTTFQSYIESFYRAFSNEDLKFLNTKHIIPPGFEKLNYDPDVSPYVIPKLGRFYADLWSEEDSSLGNKLNSSNYGQQSLDAYRPKGSMDNVSDDSLYTEDVSCGPLSSRLLSAILSIHEEANIEGDEENGSFTSENVSLYDEESVATQLSSTNTVEDLESTTEPNDFHSIEERLKRELKYIGIFMNLPGDDDDSKGKLNFNGRSIKTESRAGSIIDNDDWIKNKEDDEVSAEIRMLQQELKEATARNRQNKKKIVPLVEEQIAYQEFCTILEDLDKQVDQAYMKRLKSKNKKKKTEKAEPNPAQQQAMNTGLRSLLDKRRRWLENIGKIFPPPELMKRVPSTSVLEGETIEEEVDDEGNDMAQDVIQDKT